MSRLVAALSLALSIVLPTALEAQTPTRLVVRAVSRDAKIIGSGVGGARITVKDAATGEVLAEGIQEGSTGDTEAIVAETRPRDGTVFDTPGAAHFTTTLPLDGPTRVEVVAEGPLDTPHALQRASKTVLLIPGEHVDGEGLILFLNGFTVEIEAVEVLGEGRSTLDVRARVTMLCGCPTEPGGLWDADDIRITGQLLRDGEVVSEAPLTYAGTTSTYRGSIEAPGPGEYELRVIAVEAAEANAGMVVRTVTITAS